MENYVYAFTHKGFHSTIKCRIPRDIFGKNDIVFLKISVFKEKLSKKAFLGLALMVVGTLLMAFFK